MSKVEILKKEARKFLKDKTKNPKWDGIVHYGDWGQHELSIIDLLTEFAEAVRERERERIGNEILKHSTSVICSPIRFDGVSISKIEEITGTKPNF